MIETYSFKHFEVTAFQESKVNKIICGDSYYVHESDDYFICALADGLGSGKGAKDASQAAMDVIAKEINSPVDVIIKEVNKTLFVYRGAVITIFKINYKTKNISYCSIGNIQFIITQPNGQQIKPIPRLGFLSGRPIKVQKEVYPYPRDAMFIIYSDGFKFDNEYKIKFRSYEQVKALVGLLYKSQVENEDDMTILIGKPKGL